MFSLDKLDLGEEGTQTWARKNKKGYYRRWTATQLMIWSQRRELYELSNMMAMDWVSQSKEGEITTCPSLLGAWAVVLVTSGLQ